MSNYLYYCKTCNTLDTDYEKNQKIKCPGCGNNYSPLLITEDVWFELGDDEKRQVLYRAITNPAPFEQKTDYLRLNNAPKTVMDDDDDYYEDEEDDDDDEGFRLKPLPVALILVAVAVVTAVIAILVL